MQLILRFFVCFQINMLRVGQENEEQKTIFIDILNVSIYFFPSTLTSNCFLEATSNLKASSDPGKEHLSGWRSMDKCRNFLLISSEEIFPNASSSLSWFVFASLTAFNVSICSFVQDENIFLFTEVIWFSDCFNDLDTSSWNAIVTLSSKAAETSEYWKPLFKAQLWPSLPVTVLFGLSILFATTMNSFCARVLVSSTFEVISYRKSSRDEKLVLSVTS